MSSTGGQRVTRTRKGASSASSTASTKLSKGVKMTTEPLKVVNKRNVGGGSGGGGGGGSGGEAEVNVVNINTTTSGRSSRRRHNARDHDHSRLADLSQYSQHNEGRKDEHVAFFVLPEGLTPATCSHNLTSAFTAGTEANIVCRWMTTEDVLAHRPAGENVFVMDPFSGPAFEKAVVYKERTKCFLLGPQIFKYLISDEPSLDFGWAPPVYSVGMRNLLVTQTGVIDPIRKEELSIKITRMFGIESKSLTKGVTHVVAENMLTDKVFKAYETNIPVMTTAWIDAVWEDSQNSMVYAVDEKYVKYACRMFHNLLICVSQVPSVLKDALRNVIEANGGQYSPELIKNKTSVLIVPKPEGDKFKYAQQWRLPCVLPEWVEACKSAGHVVHPAEFAVDPRHRIVNPNNPVPVVPVSIPTSSKKTKDAAINSTPLHSMIEPMPADARYNESMLSKINGSCPSEMPTGVGTIEEDVLKKAAELLKSYAQNIEPFLDGCQIYISKNLKSEDIRKLVNGSGAMRLSTISDRVTHVIVPVDNQLQRAELQQIKELDPRPHLVKVQWLMESAKEGCPINDEKFRVIIDSKNFSSLTNMVPETSCSQSSQISITAMVEHGGSGGSSKSKISNNRSPVERLGAPATATSNQGSERMSNSREHGRNSRSRHNFAENSPPPVQEMIDMGPEEVEVELGQGDADNKASIDEDVDEDTDPKIFSGRRFNVALDIVEEREEVKNSLIDYGGKISENKYDIIIVSPIYSPETLVVRPDATLRTRQWVYDCIESATMDGDTQYFHSPMSSFPGMLDILPNVVVAISQYCNSEKEYLSVLITAMGGLCQDVFARKTSSSVQRSTHLICPKTDNDKYRAAQKWKTPVVLAEWVIDCFTSKSLRPIDPYDPAATDSQSTVNYFPRTPKAPAPASTTRGGKSQLIKDSAQTGDEQQQNQPSSSTPKAGGSTAIVFKTPVSRETRRGSITSKNKKSNDSFGVPMSDSFLEYCRTHKTPNMSMDESYQEWLKTRPRTPSPSPSELSPIIGGQLGFTRADSRALKAAFASQHINPDIGMIHFPRRSSTPVDEFVKRAIDNFPSFNGSNPPGINQPAGVNSSTPRSKRSSSSSAEPEEEDSSIHIPNGGISSKRRKISSHSESDEESEDRGSRRVTRNSCKSRPSFSTTEPASSSDQVEQNVSVSDPSSTSVSEPDIGAAAAARPEIEVTKKTATKKSNEEQRRGRSRISSRDSPEPELPQPLPAPHDEDKRPRRMDKLKNLLAIVDDQEGSNDGIVNKSVVKKRGGRNEDDDDKPNDEELGAPAVVWATDEQPPAPPVEVLDGPPRRTGKNTSSVSPIPGTTSKIPVRPNNRRKNIFSIDVPPNPIFILSGLSEEDKTSIKSTLGSLGAVVSDAQNFDPAAFAILASTLARSEKILCGIASGKPLLHAEYANACYDARELLPITDEFLWKEDDGQTPTLREIARAAQNWIKRVQKDPADTPFRGEYFFVESGAKKNEAFSRLIEAGGGSVVSSREDATIVLMSNRTASEENGVRVENVAYLSNKIVGKV